MMMPGSQSHYTSLFTTISGLIGGLGKASITVTGITTVVTYAALSATVGYVVKYGMDRVAIRLRRLSQEDKREDKKEGKS